MLVGVTGQVAAMCYHSVSSVAQWANIYMQELAAEGDRSSLYDIAKALMLLQSTFGCARILKGKGAAAQAVHLQLSRMRQELSPDELPLPGTGRLDCSTSCYACEATTWLIQRAVRTACR